MSHTLKKLLTGVSIALITVSIADVANAFQIFNSREKWEAALAGSSTTFDFSDIPVNPISSGTLLKNNLSVSYRERDFNNNNGSGFSGFTTDTGLSFTRYPQSSLNLNLGFPSPVQAFGFDTYATGSSSFANFVVTIPSLPEFAVKQRSPLSVTPFLGFISDPGTSFSNIILDCLASSCVGIGSVSVSNISVYPQIKAVPEPSSTWGFVVVFGAAYFGLKPKLKKHKLAN